MLTVIIYILKVLGIVILSMIGLAILLLLLILFVPIKYKGEGLKEDDCVKLQAAVTYLNPLVRVKISYPDQIILKLKILFFTVYTNKTDNKAVPSDDTVNMQNTLESNLAGEEINQNKNSSGEGRSEENSASNKDSVVNSKDTVVNEKEKKSNPQSDNQKSINKISEYAKLLINHKNLLFDVISIILKAIKTILPQKCKIQVVFGTGQADTTGYICAIYYAIAELLPDDFEILYEPVWTEKAFSGNFNISGKIRLIHLIAAAVKIIANKKVRNLYKLIRSV